MNELLRVDRFYEILATLEHRQIGCVNELTEKYGILWFPFQILASSQLQLPSKSLAGTGVEGDHGHNIHDWSTGFGWWFKN